MRGGWDVLSAPGPERGGRRGQVTLFFAVGLVMLIFLGIVFMTMSGNDDDGGAVRNAKDLTQNAVLNEYLVSCVDTIMNDELRILGMSGALPDATGYPKATVGTGDKAREVIFGVTRNRDCKEPVTTLGNCALFPVLHDAPRYPDTGVRLDASTTNPITGLEFLPFLDGYFGDVNFPAVCSPTGPNAANGPNACKYYYANGPPKRSNPPGTHGPSTQEELLHRVARRVEACADINVFSRATGSDVVNVSVPTVNITFTPNAVLVLFEYPVTLRGSVESRNLPIQRRYDVRYLALAQFAFDLAREETRNVTFNITDRDDYQRIASYRGGFSVGKSRGVAITSSTLPGPAHDADLVTIIDEESRIDNTPYSFSFLLEHRPPMLDVLSAASDCTPLDPQSIAADPDETRLTVRKTPIDASTVNCSVSDSDGETDWQILPLP